MISLAITRRWINTDPMKLKEIPLYNHLYKILSNYVTWLLRNQRTCTYVQFSSDASLNAVLKISCETSYVATRDPTGAAYNLYFSQARLFGKNVPTVSAALRTALSRNIQDQCQQFSGIRWKQPQCRRDV